MSAHHASSATAMTTPEETAVRTQDLCRLANCCGSALSPHGGVRVSQCHCVSAVYIRTNSQYVSQSKPRRDTRSTLTLILPKSICFWMVYICSVLSIRLAPSLQLETSCWDIQQQGHQDLQNALASQSLIHEVTKQHKSRAYSQQLYLTDGI